MARLKKSFFSDTGRSIFFAILISFALVLIFAIVVKTVGVKENVINIVNTIIKTLSIFFGVILGIKNYENGLFKGVIIGLLYIILTFLIFALISGNFTDAKFSIFDLLLGLMVGIISGIFKVNLKQKNAQK